MPNFETATRRKIRFTSSKGLLSVEQLWDVPLRSKNDFNLNEIAKKASLEVKEIVEENFVDSSVPGAIESHLKFDLVKYVIATKLQEETLSAKRAENKIEREKLLRILAEKQDGALSDLSVQELQTRINALGA